MRVSECRGDVPKTVSSAVSRSIFTKITPKSQLLSHTCSHPQSNANRLDHPWNECSKSLRCTHRCVERFGFAEWLKQGKTGTFRKLFQALFQGPLFQKSHQKVNFSHTHIFTSFPAQNTWIILETSVPSRGIVCGCVWDVLVL